MRYSYTNSLSKVKYHQITIRTIFQVARLTLVNHTPKLSQLSNMQIKYCNFTVCIDVRYVLKLLWDYETGLPKNFRKHSYCNACSDIYTNRSLVLCLIVCVKYWYIKQLLVPSNNFHYIHTNHCLGGSYDICKPYPLTYTAWYKLLLLCRRVL